MRITRRQILKLGAAGAAAATLSGCDGAWLSIGRHLDSGLPESFNMAASSEIDPDFHFLSRTSFGPRPGDFDRLRKVGRAAWLKEQLRPEGIADAACDLLANRYESLHMKPGNIREFKEEVARDELIRSTTIRASRSRRQLFEVMVEFWTDHLNIDQSKSECKWYKTADDRDVVRKHALGRFRDLIRASATSPAMLVYLDGQDNKVTRRTGPNENYARELMELHTLGVHGGYSQQDVMEVARCLTGWTLARKWSKGTVKFEPSLHDDGPKTVLGVPIPAGGGADDLERVIDIVTRHPSTARHVSEKLCRRFVADHPPATLVANTALKFTESDGDIPEVLETILTSPEFESSRGARLKRPFRFIVSSLRALGAETTAPRGLLDYFTRMGHAPFAFPTPDGYPDETTPWLGTFLWRWNFALALCSNRIGGVTVRLGELFEAAGTEDPIDLFPHFAGRRPTDRERGAISGFMSAATGVESKRNEAVALIIASPVYQRF